MTQSAEVTKNGTSQPKSLTRYASSDRGGAARKVATNIERDGPGDADRQFQASEGQATERDAEFRIVGECRWKNSDCGDDEACDANDAASIGDVAGAAQKEVREPAAGEIGESAR